MVRAEQAAGLGPANRAVQPAEYRSAGGAVQTAGYRPVQAADRECRQDGAGAGGQCIVNFCNSCFDVLLGDADYRDCVYRIGQEKAGI